MPEPILLVEDEPLQRKMMSMLLEKKMGFRVTAAANGQEALDYIVSAAEPFCAVLLDISMPVMDGFKTLTAIRERDAQLPVLMLTSQSGTEVAVRAIKQGANDFIVKPVDPAKLEVALSNAMRLASLSREVTRLKRDREGALSFADLVGAKQGLAGAVVYGRKAAQSDVPVLIFGETGTGKELFARAIHGESRRVGGPFIAINCGAIPENLVESILFGHEKGAFTGAIARSIGKFREAEGGTLFLDEIGELPLDAQVKLLRAIQQKEVEPVGAGRPVKVNVRIISATNRELKREVATGRFREDLYFRLNVLPIALPPLRERGSDVLTLANHFLERFAGADMAMPKRLAVDAAEYVLKQRWPGNVRELENLMRRALVLCEGEQISAQQLMQIHEVADAPAGPAASARGSAGIATAAPLMLNLLHEGGQHKTMHEIEQETMRRVLAHYDDNIARAADSLRIAKSTFYRKLKEGEA